jgi:hypothetical protein
MSRAASRVYGFLAPDQQASLVQAFVDWHAASAAPGAYCAACPAPPPHPPTPPPIDSDHAPRRGLSVAQARRTESPCIGSFTSSRGRR